MWSNLGEGIRLLPDSVFLSVKSAPSELQGLIRTVCAQQCLGSTVVIPQPQGPTLLMWAVLAGADGGRGARGDEAKTSVHLANTHSPKPPLPSLSLFI